MNTRNISMVAILLVLVSLGVFASQNADLTGSDFARLGKLGIVSGTLSEQGGEWYLKSADTQYALHLGNHEVIYPKGITLKAGAEAVVRGFVLGPDVSVVAVATPGSRYSLRTAAGVPLWSGQGARHNQQAFQNKRIGQANYRQPVPMAQGRHAGFQGPGQGMQGRQAGFQGPGQGRPQGRR